VTTLPILLVLAAAQAPDSPAGQPTPLRIEGVIKEPRKTKDVAPEYPEDAIRAGLTGVVILDCVVDVKGHVQSADVKRGSPTLAEAAIKAVRKWRYTPTLLDGKPVPVIMTITVNFTRSSGIELRDLIDSLNHKDEFIREAAAANLGRARPGGGISPGEMADVVRRLTKLHETDTSERVRTAAARSLERIEGR
jgi:TonB family protein